MKFAVFDDLPEGGAKRVVFEQIKGLSINHEISYFTNDLPSIFSVDQFAKHTKKYSLDWPVWHGLSRVVFESLYFANLEQKYEAIKRDILATEPDVVLVHPSRITQASPLLYLIKEVPVVYFAEEWLRIAYETNLHPLPAGIRGKYESWRRGRVAEFDKKWARAASKVVVTSNMVQDDYRQAYDIETQIIPLGVDENVFSNQQSQLKNQVLFLGEAEAINGYELALEVCQKSSTDLKQVGFKNKSFSLSESELVSEYNQSLSVLCFGKREPFGLVAIEAGACEVPVIAINEGGYLDTIIDNQTGFLVSRDTDLIVNRINYLKKNSPARAKMGQEARKRILLHFTISQHILELERYLEEVWQEFQSR